jgi:hypothetical protein
MPMIKNPAVSILENEIANLFVFREGAGADVMAPNNVPLSTVTIDKAPVQDLLDTLDASVTDREVVMLRSIEARISTKFAEMTALPYLIEAP